MKDINNNGIIDDSERKHWSEGSPESSWRIFRIMSEFVEGFEKLEKIPPCVSIYEVQEQNPILHTIN